MKLLDQEFTDLFLAENDYAMRVQGMLRPINKSDLLGDAELILDRCHQRFRESDSVDFRLEVDGVTFRCVALDSINTDVNRPCFVLRKLPDEVSTWKELRLPDKLLDNILFGMDRGEFKRSGYQQISHGGIVFLFGETDTGKSTTLNALIHEMANRESWLFMTFEDPVETQFTADYPTGAKIIQRELSSFELVGGLKTALRANADVIKVGEVRDQETARLTIDAALAGHTVLTSLHASSISEGLQRFSGLLGNDHKLLSQAFRCCIHQTMSRMVGLDTRVMTYTFLCATQSVRNQLQEGQFKGLSHIISMQTKDVKSAGF